MALGGYGPVRLPVGQQLLDLGPYSAGLSSASETEEITTLWVGNALPGTNDVDLAAAFSQFGRLMCCFLLKRLSANGHLSGFVRYTTRAEAAHALEAVLAGQVSIKGSTLTAKWTEKNSKPLAAQSILSSYQPETLAVPTVDETSGEDITTIWVGNVLPGTVDADMAAAFTRFGELMCCFLLKRLSPNGQLSGFVRYTTRAEAAAALDGTTSGAVVVKGSVITAKWASTNSKPLCGAPTSMAQPPPVDAFGEAIATLWVGNVQPGTSDTDMAVGFSPYGNMLCCFLLKKLSPNGQLSGFVRYTTRAEADRAMDAVNAGRVVVNGFTINAKWATHNSKPLEHLPVPQAAAIDQGAHSSPLAAQPQSRTLDANSILQALQAAQFQTQPHAQPVNDEEIMTLWVSNVAPGATDADFTAIMGSFGKLVCAFLFSSTSPEGTMSGFAQYRSRMEAAYALQALGNGGYAFNGAVLGVRWAQENARPPV